MPNVAIVSQNLTNGYSEDYDDDTDHEQRLQFAMEVDRVSNL